jgi:hypothetical protein
MDFCTVMNSTELPPGNSDSVSREKLEPQRTQGGELGPPSEFPRIPITFETRSKY